MKRILVAIAALASVLVFSACASVKVADDFGNQSISDSGKNVAHVYGTNWGLYCLSIPLITGSTENPGSIVFGQDTVNPKSVVKMVTKKSGDLGANKTLDLDTKGSSVWIFPTFVLFLNEYQVSGNAIK